MQQHRILHQPAALNFTTVINGVVHFWNPMVFGNISSSQSSIINPCSLKTVRKKTLIINPSRNIKCFAKQNLEEVSDDNDDELCPVECVREFKTDEEFLRILEKAKETNALVVVDFYRTSCGSCKYIEQGFAKLCKGSGDDEAAVIFLKHNVLDEYDEQSEVADRLRIRSVPLFHFYKNGVMLEAFPTRDKERILEAILKYTSPAFSRG
ncbi:thioredoxin-like 4, chloroplastic [Andrographis paniculata]|uniref:thioredoxin-like 4, chloroplastic n=1 Tax=Andrographis paniculata TaxID=175694 RepID=UPI0021E9170F|nr:thioredoxin-like 4, chloroplastic [Andrographis paniculata]